MWQTKRTQTAEQTRCQSISLSVRPSIIQAFTCSFIHSFIHSGIALVKFVEAWFEPRKYISLVNFLNSNKNKKQPNMAALAVAAQTQLLGCPMPHHSPTARTSSTLPLLPCLSSRQMLKCGARVRTPQTESKSIVQDCETWEDLPHVATWQASWLQVAQVEVAAAAALSGCSLNWNPEGKNKLEYLMCYAKMRSTCSLTWKKKGQRRGGAVAERFALPGLYCALKVPPHEALRGRQPTTT